MRDLLDQIPTTLIPHASRDQLDSQILLEEIVKAISDLPKGRAPGPDGLTPEFYQEHVAILAPRSLEV